MTLVTRSQLRDAGITDRTIAQLVASGRLDRLRGGVFSSGIAKDVVNAVRGGGRLACASELRRLGVWILDDRLHVHFSNSRCRLRGGVRHWGSLLETPALGWVDVLDAVLQAMDCLDRRAAVAALDSALHLGLVSYRRLANLRLTKRARGLLAVSDGRSESGLETLARLIARDLGFAVASQVEFSGVGRVDLVLESAVVVEADGDRFHSNLAARRRDRRRDAQLAAQGYTVLRFGYDQLVGRPREVAFAIIDTVARHPAVKDSRRICARARARAERAGWT